MTRNRHLAYLIHLCCVFAGIYTCLLTNREERYIMQYSKLSSSDQLIIKYRNGSFGARFGFARLYIVHEFVFSPRHVVLTFNSKFTSTSS